MDKGLFYEDLSKALLLAQRNILAINNLTTLPPALWAREFVRAGLEAGPAHEGRDQRRRAEARLQFAVVVEKLLPPADVIFQNLVEFGAGGNLHDAFVEFVARAEPFGIPRRDFAEHPAAVFLAKNFNHQIQMPAHHPHALGKGGFGWKVRLVTAGESLRRVANYEWGED